MYPVICVAVLSKNVYFNLKYTYDNLCKYQSIGQDQRGRRSSSARIVFVFFFFFRFVFLFVIVLVIVFMGLYLIIVFYCCCFLFLFENIKLPNKTRGGGVLHQLLRARLHVRHPRQNVHKLLVTEFKLSPLNPICPSLDLSVFKDRRRYICRSRHPPPPPMPQYHRSPSVKLAMA